MSSLLNKIVSLCASRRDPEDSDPQETEKWLEALEAVVEHAGRARMEYLLDRLAALAQELAHRGQPAVIFVNEHVVDAGVVAQARQRYGKTACPAIAP